VLGKGAIVGAYRVGEAIGEGGMCAVYRGTHTLLDRHVAIKVLLPEHAENQEIVQRFFNEALALTKLADPGIVQVFDYGHDSAGSPYIVMEFLEGESMARRLSRVKRFDLLEGVRLMRLMCTSLGVAHAKGIIHRDNIFLVADPSVPDGERAKVLDFGIAKISFDEHAQTKTRTNALIGTPTYMSPEQCSGGGGVDCRSDIYSMGCVMFAMLTGQPPFRGAGLGDVIAAHLRECPPLASSRVPELHPFIDAILDRCLRKDPGERFQSMTELSRVLGSVEHALSRSIKELDILVLPDLVGSVGTHEPTVSMRPGSPPMPPAQGRASLSAMDLSGTTLPITTLGGATGRTSAPGTARGIWSKGRIAGLLAIAATLMGTTAFMSFSGREEALPIVSPPATKVPAYTPDAMGPVDAGSADAPPDAAVVDAAEPPVKPSDRRRPHSGTGAPRPPAKSKDSSDPPAATDPPDPNARAKELELDENGLPINR
jgi:eukaryotic-like serine/threonine-protein kinase